MEKTLESVLLEKVHNKIKHQQEKIQNNLSVFKYVTDNMEDKVITINGNRPYVDYEGDDLKFKFKPSEENGIRKSIHIHALSQLASKLDIPTGYALELSKGEEWKKHLLANTLTEYLTHTKRQTALVRSVGNDMMAFLSDRYRRLDSKYLLNMFAKKSVEQGAVVYDFYTDRIKSWMEVILPEIIPITTSNNGTVNMFFGMRFSNSDFGDGALDVKSFLLQAICLNGMTRQTQLRQIHLGARIKEDDGASIFSQKTYELDTRTMTSAMEDLVVNGFNRENIKSQSMMIQKASDIELNPENEIKLLPKVGILKEEVKEVEDILIASRVEDGIDGKFTLWKLAQSVSAMARNKEERRKRDIEEIVGKMMDRAN